MKRINQHLKTIICFCLLGTLFSSCVKKDYDEPVTANLDPDLTVTHTLAQLNAMAGAAPVLITGDIVVAGVIIADDKSGNFYKAMIIQDSTAGLAIQVDISNFNSNYPIGRRVFVKCKGLYIANNGGNYELGIKDLNAIGRIPQSLVPQYIVKGMWGVEVVPATTTIATMTSLPTNTLVRLNNVEFDDSYIDVSYANPYLLTSSNLYIVDCSNASIDLYSSGYASFAGTHTPSGNGSIVAVYTIYSGNPELQIRDLNDVNMPNLRCDGSNGTTSFITIDSLRNIYNGVTMDAPGGIKIKGVVVSDYVNLNTDPKNVMIQDSTGGIIVRFIDAHSFSVGTEITVNVSGQSLTEFHSSLEVNYVDQGRVTIVNMNVPVTPRVVTLADAVANFEAWESTLVKVTGVTITGSGTYGGSNTINDASGTPMTLYTDNVGVTVATFANSAYPTVPSTITGVLTQYDATLQISIRNPTDVQ